MLTKIFQIKYSVNKVLNLLKFKIFYFTIFFSLFSNITCLIILISIIINVQILKVDFIRYLN